MDLLPIPLISGGAQMSNMPEDTYNRLFQLIQSSENKELECREFLQYAKTNLVTETVSKFVYVEKEHRGNSGDSDYIISCNTSDETGVEAVKAYIWELKAPQCYIFEKDNENRLRPTKELFHAENQLLHYFHERKGCEQFRNEFGVTHSDNVHFGGIIIGCHARRIKGEFEADKGNKLFEKALMIRKKYLYEPLHIRIIHWDYILDLLKPPSALTRTEVEVNIPSQVLDSNKIVLESST